MSEDYKGRTVPRGRVARLARFGGLAAGVAGNMLADGGRSLASGRGLNARDLLLTPANVSRVADELSRLRGAAMKVGQMMSMDAGDVLPAELADLLARLREAADPMPPRELRRVLDAGWGAGWLSRFERFGVKPISAASIGQVHRALTKDGRDLAIKVQYPGVRQSIDSDVDNVVALIGMTGLVPRSLDLAPVLAEAKRQLHEEADYQREAAHLSRFADLLEGDPRFAVPRPHADLTGPDILAMDHLPGAPVDTLAAAPRERREAAMTALVELVFRELFEFGLMQTDPNFANYRWDEERARLVLLDFGATREIDGEFAAAYRALLAAAVAGDGPGMESAALSIGLIDSDAASPHRAAISRMIEMASEPFRAAGGYDFGASDLPARMRDIGLDLARSRDFSHAPPPKAVFLHRKFAGLYLLARRLDVRVDVAGIAARWV
jgi:predicted unusual protein kinase regulating ubiquinone biosynthesis (AarF/ABC1/UbiB family)